MRHRERERERERERFGWFAMKEAKSKQIISHTHTYTHARTWPVADSLVRVDGDNHLANVRVNVGVLEPLFQVVNKSILREACMFPFACVRARLFASERWGSWKRAI